MLMQISIIPTITHIGTIWIIMQISVIPTMMSTGIAEITMKMMIDKVLD